MLAIADNIRAWSLSDVLVAVIVIVICVGITIIVVKACEIPIPPWVWKILGLCLLGVLAIFAIRFVTSL